MRGRERSLDFPFAWRAMEARNEKAKEEPNRLFLLLEKQQK
jgi:hypothetical protein